MIHFLINPWLIHRQPPFIIFNDFMNNNVSIQYKVFLTYYLFDDKKRHYHTCTCCTCNTFKVRSNTIFSRRVSNAAFRSVGHGEKSNS